MKLRTFFAFLIITLSLQGCRMGMSDDATVIYQDPGIFNYKGKLQENIGLEGPDGKMITLLPIGVKGTIAESFQIRKDPNQNKEILLKIYRGQYKLVSKNTIIGKYQVGEASQLNAAVQIKVTLGMKDKKILLEAKNSDTGALIPINTVLESQTPAQEKLISKPEEKNSQK